MTWFDLQLFAEDLPQEPVEMPVAETPVTVTERVGADDVLPSPTPQGVLEFMESRQMELENVPGQTESVSTAPPTTPSMVQLPPEIVQALAQIALQNKPQQAEEIPQALVPEPVLPELPEMPDILKEENREDAMYEDPLGFHEAFFDYNWRKRQVEQERERILTQYKTQVKQQTQLKQYTEAFAEQIRVLGQETFDAYAERAEKIIKETPSLLSLPPKEAVNIAFKMASVPRAQEINKMPQVELNALKEQLRPIIIQEYLKGVSTGKTTPQLITGQLPAGKMPITPSTSPQNLDEAKRQWLRSMGIGK